MSDHRKCSKPGCGALSILGKACLDRDCPQTWVHYTAHNAEIDRLNRELAEAQKDRDYWKVEAEGERAKVEFRDKKAVEKTKRLVQATKIISSYVERDENDGVTTGGDWGRLDAAKEFLAKLKEKP